MFFQRLKNETGQLVSLSGTAKQDGAGGKFSFTFDKFPDHPVPCE